MDRDDVDDLIQQAVQVVMGDTAALVTHYVLVAAAVTEDGEDQIVTGSPDSQRAWQSVGLLENGLVYEREKIRAAED